MIFCYQLVFSFLFIVSLFLVVVVVVVRGSKKVHGKFSLIDLAG